MTARTYTLAEAADIIGAPSTRWLREQIKLGRFTAYKPGRHWRMTDEDIAAAIDACRTSLVRINLTPEVGLNGGETLTRTTRRRIS